MSEVKLLDGGFSTQLAIHVGKEIDGDPLWTARFLATDKEKCFAVHCDFIRAGADIIMTGSYQASINGFKKYLGLEKEEALLMIKDSVRLAREAIKLEEQHQGKKLHVAVAGSVGPYGATLHDGSEYRGDYGATMSKKELMDWHRPRINALIEGGVDLLALETIPCSTEALALIEVLKENPCSKAWLSFSVKDPEKISSGEPLKEIVDKCWELGSDQLVAVGVNCLHPAMVAPILGSLKSSSPHIPFIAYPNSGETYDGSSKKWLESTKSTNILKYLHEWLDLGISFVGGCCRTNDSDIKQFREEISKWQEKKRLGECESIQG